MFNHLLNSTKHYKRNGLHLNQEGKETVCRSISNWLSRSLGTLPQQALKATTPLSPPDRPSSDKNFLFTTTNENIQIINANMTDVINNSSTYQNTAFAHCISADIKDKKKHVCGSGSGVQKILWKTNANRFYSHLAYQQIHGKPSVYSLVTKPKYYHKPTQDDYNEAFRRLSEDFKGKGFTQLIFPLMGCVRDKLPPELFTKNIIKFQEKTQAKITIVVLNGGQEIDGKKHRQYHQHLPRRIFKLLSVNQSDSSTGKTLIEAAAPSPDDSLTEDDQPREQRSNSRGSSVLVSGGEKSNESKKVQVLMVQ